MFESNKEKQQMYAQMVELQDRAQQEKFTQEDLREVCDTVFGKESDLSKLIQEAFIKSGKVRPDTSEKVTPTQKVNIEDEKTWKLDSEEEVKIQEKAAEIGHKYGEQSKQQSEIQQPIQESQTQNLEGMEL